MDLRGKRVLIMGLGLQGSGMAAARYAAQQGAIVRVTDMKSAEILAPSVRALASLPIEFVLGEHRDEDFLWAEMVIRNPGIPLSSRYLQLAHEHGASIEMEIALFFLTCPGRILGVTGTRGKTTTSTLLYKILTESGAPTVLGGNVAGVETLSLLPQITAETLVVLELSSWQLEGLAPHELSPALAVMTNVYPDHLNTYSGMEEYAEAKATIFRYQHPSDLALFNYDNPWTRRFGEEARAETWFASVERGGSFKRGSEVVAPFIFMDVPLVGKHNLENVLLATTAARLLGVPDENIASSVRNFHGVAQRLEEVAVVNGVHFINDSTSTTPIAGRVGVEAFSGCPIVLVAGGNSKQLPLENWPDAIVRNCRDVILLQGTGTAELVPALRKEVARQGASDPLRGIYDNFTAALDRAVSLAQPGDVLLFSPGFTSFGMFLNEFDRGDRFNEYVQGLKAEASS
ncbi:MAG TPA: UDP-N-acetylmuramoyl-L-alanine--D-glutamate ligase [Ktedonobacter sp.]|jgi:UDP-N-acetylmuramoylalanine--D-glutamate ligase|nr:UDP-N-acetylmuramoyl-L-alanine--D-glutamate ligase [Ktedonobacter sp.]HAT45098.1 UDP-N-acetylmuramoyl-L-alanine--D-glutamate ligase [Ktedonobacter sp.]HBE26773.1 UDP-N-acetylmuramoyl-L-alanine--D-glutamate ligase [Ktedonobacter sp.]HBE28253.1 UDP-N-acetylmuramoyl-L-alanine--D-glutamate ligase [Ktedonobacter sp.]HCF87774.1 UDP-N-acetylmuramoyl-L-alanine--D-glutamate ligase [Ktedonobacter sp.]